MGDGAGWKRLSTTVKMESADVAASRRKWHHLDRSRIVALLWPKPPSCVSIYVQCTSAWHPWSVYRATPTPLRWLFWSVVSDYLCGKLRCVINWSRLVPCVDINPRCAWDLLWKMRCRGCEHHNVLSNFWCAWFCSTILRGYAFAIWHSQIVREWYTWREFKATRS